MPTSALRQVVSSAAVIPADHAGSAAAAASLHAKSAPVERRSPARFVVSDERASGIAESLPDDSETLLSQEG